MLDGHPHGPPILHHRRRSIILQSAVNGLGTAAIASVAAGAKLFQLICCPYDAMGSSMATYCGQNVGACKLDRLGQGMRACAWLGLDVPLDTASTKHVLVLFGTLSGLASHQAVEAALAETTELCQVQWAGRAGELQYVLVLCHRKAGEAARDALKSFGFTATSFRGWKGTARSNIDQIEDRQRILSQELEACRARLAQEPATRPRFRSA